MLASYPSPRQPKLGKNERDIFLASLFAKVLLFPAYRSTDFEVHRNWLAITKSLPLKQWYFDNTSEWTLDYPPFFAYFERALSEVAHLLDPQITQLSKTQIATWPVVAFQRSSVLASELVLGFALYRYIRPSEPSTRIIAASLLLHPGLLFVDSIHFQYNGMLLGLLLLSLVSARNGNLPRCALFFAVLLNFKHIFIYLAPPYLVYLFRAHCFNGQGIFQPHRLVQLGTIVGGVCAASFMPFLLAGGFDQIKQILSRLFPFQRGLNHAYWAGNVWALYSAADRVLVKYLLWRGLPVSKEAVNSASRGLIGDITFGVLPEIKPSHCFVVTLAFNALFLVKLWQQPTYKRFLKAVTLSAFTSFLFGFHVHEKAILLVLFPLSLLAAEDYEHYRIFVMTSFAGIFALFPLLIQAAESPIKFIYATLWFSIVFPMLSKSIYRPTPTTLGILMAYAENTYLYNFPVLQFMISIVHPWYYRSPSSTAAADLVNQDGQQVAASRPALEFLPLMVTSVYCALGITWAWIKLSYLYMKQ